MQFNIADLFESVVDVVPDSTALVSGSTRLSYAELDGRANRLGHFLIEQGVKPGDHVGMYLFNCSEYLVALLATFKVRAVPVNINYRYVEDELRYMCRDSDLVALFYHRGFAERLEALRGDLPKLRTLVHVDDETDADTTKLGSTEFEDALASQSDVREFPERSGKDIYIIYTGGTTGMPKGVMWRHEDVFFAGLQGGRPGGEPITRPEELAEVVKAGGSMTMMPAAPFIHGAAQWSSLITFFGGGKAVVQPGRSFDPQTCARLIDAEKVNILTLVGDAMSRPVAEAVRAFGDELDTSSVFVIGSAGAVLSESTKVLLKEVFPNCFILDSFGATETGHQGQMLEGTGHGASKAPRFMMSDHSKVFDDNLEPVVPGSGVIGKLARRGYLPVGYYKDPVKTAETFIELGGERWAMPGDLATVESDGSISVFGRGTVCINSGGEKIFPEEVEAALKAHPGVGDAIVVGIPDPRWGQKVAAIVAPRDGVVLSPAELTEHCRTKVARYKTPRFWHFVDQVARQPSGKPDYRWAKTTATQAAEAAEADSAN
ncbi:MAG: acyl-CoA synthetase (AMP-forming)/AMP-acid ligase II [Hyphomicrobiaceae bacterium]|jgi:acyl-CoA synthetase (AMP-forming)/AMP-acid ligase II